MRSHDILTFMPSSEQGQKPKFKALIFRVDSNSISNKVHANSGWQNLPVRIEKEVPSVTEFFSQWIRANDLPRALLEKHVYRRDWYWHLEYLFEVEDGTLALVPMDTILHHPWSQYVPKRLFPLLFNLKEELRLPLRRLTQPTQELDKCIQSCLVHASYFQKELEFSIYISFNREEETNRCVLPLQKIFLQNQNFGIWQLSPVADLENMKGGVCDLHLLPPYIEKQDYFDSQMWLQSKKQELIFHTFQNEFANMKTQLMAPGSSLTTAGHEVLRAKGHAFIEILQKDLEEKLFTSGGKLIFQPPTKTLEKAHYHPRLKLYSNGTAHLSVGFDSPDLEKGYILQGFPQSLGYLFSALGMGIGAVANMPLTQIA
ncbi:MAG: hypothetical protein AB7H97_12445, partial [Pseudobdellovibrionaceae bacterium]